MKRMCNPVQYFYIFNLYDKQQKMQTLILSLVTFILTGTVMAQEPASKQVYNEGTVTYNVSVVTGNTEAKAADLLDGATQKIYFKGTQTRTELVSILGTTITLHDTKSGNGAIMNEYGDQKIMIRMTKQNFTDRNQKFVGVDYEFKNDTKTILGYKCKLAVAKLKDGSEFRVYYSPDLAFQNKDYGVQFQNLPGFPLEYESELGKMKVTYVADKIVFDPVAAAVFDLPKSGYREMSYDEVKKLKGS
jgi:GLPGLI family protein